MKYTVRATSRFRKDYKLMQKRGLEMSRLDEVIAMLASGDTLDEKYHDHALGGDYAGIVSVILLQTGFLSITRKMTFLS